MPTEQLIALFLVFTAVAYLIAYLIYAERTLSEQTSFFNVALFYVIAGIFFLIYSALNYYNIAHGKAAKHIDYLDKQTQQGKYQPGTNNLTQTNYPIEVQYVYYR